MDVGSSDVEQLREEIDRIETRVLLLEDTVSELQKVLNELRADSGDTSANTPSREPNSDVWE